MDTTAPGDVLRSAHRGHSTKQTLGFREVEAAADNSLLLWGITLTHSLQQSHTALYGFQSSFLRLSGAGGGSLGDRASWRGGAFCARQSFVNGNYADAAPTFYVPLEPYGGLKAASKRLRVAFPTFQFDGLT